ncbi:MAG: SH3 type 3 domain protein [Candidatus Collierbacteria bacterium GW2011_GWB1_45_35]|uniref:SH3 type 3 domain protein n=1 Tax=Candidatus Collierbacteria bacterium GW2011_GWB2_45_17 TaxID=1618388 RepID=A0A837IJG9_9BACT|nr:MAG: SH3 type 3 domain protein [Microgenomates group bacterium GW2011_GWC1_44_23]KKT96205.1 MAG: SH3 type 3 domain protein [Candidatus Collierbacteria bacterium GW2011_GWA1_45_15]KKU01245.1 MAG: SH3 type 3 domain protein [Candidatus Collierbacteria bacterium GW2011_GWB2_45_17]KKU05328.1 MAG: SH3 type 3 domain protein [Candidatus Collierbacteria bacterium GW2011_GWB1_45_35]KKU08475.1 MAG: SH3 type 3 domain protein [Candidatus Collierbacteria bacterium GW2011_GWC2_45_40]HBC45031.1 hypothetica
MKISWLIFLFLIIFLSPLLFSQKNPSSVISEGVLEQPSVIRDLKSENSVFTLLFGGDVMLGRSVNTRIIKYADFSWPFRKITSLFSEADLTMVNLESPFQTGCKPTDKGMIFCADPRSVEGLTTAGIDIVNLANNHINNQGQEGIDETINILNKNNIAYVGARRDSSVVFNIKNTKIAFLGFTDIASGSKDVSTASPDSIKSQISEAKKSADLVITTFHWGNEYSQRSLHQVELAHLAINSGADVVIGHHPHWVQETEEYKGKPIYYSLGNLVFDQMWSEETRKGLVVSLIFSGNQLVNKEEIPIKIFDYGQPNLVN